MRIWAFPSFYPYNKPGHKWSGIFAHRQYKGLIELGAELNVILPVLWAPPAPLSNLNKQWKQQNILGYPLKRIYDGITVHHPRISNFKPSRIVKKSFDERYIESIVDFFTKEGIQLDPKKDIFYSQWLPEAKLVQQVAHRLGLKSAILSIGDDVIVWPNQKPENMTAFKKLLKEADLRFACADYLGREANKLIKEDLPYSVVRWGVDHKFLKPATVAEKNKYRLKYKIPKHKVVVLTIGTAIVRKGWLDLFKAVNEVRRSYDNFVLVGVHAGAAELDLNEEAKKMGVEDLFINLGEIKPEQLNEIFSSADMFCLPSHWEGLANVIIEAMSSGLPVITTDVCGHPELITNNINGILIPPKRPDILAQKLLKLFSDELLRKTLAGNSRNHIVNEWGDFSKML